MLVIGMFFFTFRPRRENVKKRRKFSPRNFTKNKRFTRRNLKKYAEHDYLSGVFIKELKHVDY